jgi:squalene-hopene/tetraprenyl-beta-curcumene cyclase
LNDPAFRARLFAARDQTVAALLAERTSDGHWVGELSGSALSTATAVCALWIWGRNGGKATAEHSCLMDGGLRWLAEHANEDGGWGDTDRSFSNISTTTLVWAAFGATGPTTQYIAVMERAEQWLVKRAGSLSP